MEPIAGLFDRMDRWRHFPNYQLERRADIFFSLYLADVLGAKLGFPVSEDLAPEFPVRIGTIYPSISEIDKSCKIDYLAMSADGTKPIFVELKTDGASRRETQDNYLLASQLVGLPALLEGLFRIFRATTFKRKYFSLLMQLQQMDLIRIDASLVDIMAGTTLGGLVAASHAIEVVARSVETPRIIYVQPTGEGQGIISFHEFADVVDRQSDAVSRRFAASLREWANVQA